MGRPTSIFIALFLFASLIAPSPFVVIEPGGGRNVLGSLIAISGEKTYPVSGELLLTTVYATSPDSHLLGIDVLTAWIKGEQILFPRDVIYPNNQSAEEIDATNTTEMDDSQQFAKVAALKYLGYSIPSKVSQGKDGKKITTYKLPFKISINLKGTGGPSGGLIFALGIVEKLSPTDFLHGRKVAGTGTITPRGHVGGIGGIDEKMIAAKKAGASIFLAPQENCEDIGHIPAGLKMYIVSNLSQAISALKNGGKSLPTCP